MRHSKECVIPLHTRGHTRKETDRKRERERKRERRNGISKKQTGVCVYVCMCVPSVSRSCFGLKVQKNLTLSTLNVRFSITKKEGGEKRKLLSPVRPAVDRKRRKGKGEEAVYAVLFVCNVCVCCTGSNWNGPVSLFLLLLLSRDWCMCINL